MMMMDTLGIIYRTDMKYLLRMSSEHRPTGFIYPQATPLKE